MAMEEVLLRADKISKKVGGKQILSEISFSVLRGQIIGVLGANGAGKSTLLKILSTILLPDVGTLKINGIDAIAEPKRACRQCGAI